MLVFGTADSAVSFRMIANDCQIDVVINQGRDNKIKDVVVKDANLGK